MTNLLEDLTKEIVKHRTQLTDSDWDELKFDIYEPEILRITSTNTSVRYKLYKGSKERFVKSTRSTEIIASIQRTEAYDKALQFLMDHSCRPSTRKEFPAVELDIRFGALAYLTHQMPTDASFKRLKELSETE